MLVRSASKHQTTSEICSNSDQEQFSTPFNDVERYRAFFQEAYDKKKIAYSC